MNIGALDRQIVIQSYTTSLNTFGEKVNVWATFVTLWANVQKHGGVEKLEGGKNTATNKVKFKVRYFAGITEDMRIVYNSQDYDIHEIQELGREGLWITASRKK